MSEHTRHIATRWTLSARRRAVSAATAAKYLIQYRSLLREGRSMKAMSESFITYTCGVRTATERVVVLSPIRFQPRLL